MQVDSERRAALKDRAVEELRALLLIAGYLAAFLCALTLYRDVTVSPGGLRSFRYGYNLLEALLLAKVILIGKALHVGKRHPGGVLLVRVLSLTLAYGLLVLAFSALEHVLEGVLRGESLRAVLEALRSENRDEILVRTLIILVAFVPIFTLSEVGRALGADKVGALFFKRVTP